jgi:hypothetical protein
MTQTINLSAGTLNHHSHVQKDTQETYHHHADIKSCELWGRTLKEFLLAMFNYDMVWKPTTDNEEVPF